jgi:hypothetical protein
LPVGLRRSICRHNRSASSSCANGATPYSASSRANQTRWAGRVWLADQTSSSPRRGGGLAYSAGHGRGAGADSADRASNRGSGAGRSTTSRLRVAERTHGRCGELRTLHAIL